MIDHHGSIALLIDVVIGVILTIVVYKISTKHERGRRNHAWRRIRNRMEVIEGTLFHIVQNYNTLTPAKMAENFGMITYLINDINRTIELVEDIVSADDADNISSIKEIYDMHYQPSFQQYGYNQQKIQDFLIFIDAHYKKLPPKNMLSRFKAKGYQ